MSRVRSSWESSGRRAWRSKTTRSGWRGSSSPRAVSRGSSARTVPMPTAIASDSARQRWTSAWLGFAGDPGRVAGGRGGSAVEGHRQLQGDERQAGAGVLAERLVEEARGGRLLAGGEADLDPAVAEDPGPAAGGLLGGIVRGDHHPRDARLEDRIDAGRLAALVGAGLERHVHRRPVRIAAALGEVGERRPLRVQAAERRMEPLAKNLAVADDHGADEGIGADPATPALRELQRAPHLGLIRACELVFPSDRLTSQSVQTLLPRFTHLERGRVSSRYAGITVFRRRAAAAGGRVRCGRVRGYPEPRR